MQEANEALRRFTAPSPLSRVAGMAAALLLVGAPLAFSVLSTSPAAPVTGRVEPSVPSPYRPVSFAELASFPILAAKTRPVTPLETREASGKLRRQIPEVIRSLEGAQVAVRGFMLPLKSKDGVATDFMLLRDQSLCCYGVTPALNEWVVVRTTGRGVKITMDIPITVLGTFHVGGVADDGQAGIYFLDCDHIEVAKS